MLHIQRSLVLRFFISMLVAFGFGWLISEAAFRLLADQYQRAPATIEMVIPPGAAQKAASGEDVQTLPADVVFVEGDVLVVVNHDQVSHQLGPIWVPPGARGRINLDTPSRYSMACTFQSSNTFGLDVRPRVSAWARVQAILAIGLPSGVLLGLYSLVVYPMQGGTRQTG